MTVESSYDPNVLSYTGPGRYDFTFYIPEDTDLVATFINTVGVSTVLSRSDYTVVKNSEPGIGGYITTTAPADTEGQIELSRDVPLTQPVRWSVEGNLNLDKVEESFDRSVLLIQQAFAAIRNAAMQLVWKGTWVSLYEYDYLDIVRAANGNWYCCIVAHTSGTFADDLSDGYWTLVIDTVSLLLEARAAMEEVADDMTAIGERSDAVSTDFYEATAGQTEFTITSPAKEDNILVFMNSRKLRLGEDYALNSSVAASLLTLDSGADDGDEIEIISFNTYDVAPYIENASAILSSGATAAEINAKLAAHLKVTLLPGTYVVDEQLVMQETGELVGSGKKNTILSKAFNGDMFLNFPAGAAINSLTLDGNGATYTGRILPVEDGDGQQSMRDFAIIDAESYCLEFEGTTSGSQSTFINGTIARTGGLTLGNFSVKIADTERTSATPIKFVCIETEGTQFVDFGGGNNVFCDTCWAGGYRYTPDTRAAIVSDGRIANIANMDIDGHGNIISGCDVGPSLVVVSSADNITLQGNTYNGTVTDNSGNGRNLIDYLSVAYTPAWTASVSNPSIGNGSLIGEQTRSGDKITVSIELTIGSTTTLGSGTWRFSLPKTPLPNTGVTQMFPVFLTDSGTTQIVGMAYIVNNQGYIEIAVPGGLSLVNSTSPWAWAVNDMIRASFTYMV